MIFIFVLLCLVLSGLAKAAPSCRCARGDPCWPTAADIRALQNNLSDPTAFLSDIRPPASVCHGEEYNPDACAFVQANWANDVWRTSLPGAAVSPILESEAPYNFDPTQRLVCDYSTPANSTCAQGRVPSLGVAVKNENDIATSLVFAHKHNLRVVVKNTGHDMLGRSMGEHAFMIWTHQLKDREIKSKFVPAGCSADAKERAVVRLSAGVQWSEAYDLVAASPDFVVGGLSVNGTVGAAGGWLTGGGHSLVSPSYGLGVDNVVQMRVVLPFSDQDTVPRIVDVSACSHPDLFWALRGGGGGTFGIVTEVFYRLHKDEPGLLATFSASTQNVTQYQAMVSTYYRDVATLSRDQWGGYAFFTPQPAKDNSPGKYNVAVLMYSANTSSGDRLQQVNATVQQLLSNLSTIMDPSSVSSGVHEVESWKQGMKVLGNIMHQSGSSALTRRASTQNSDAEQPADASETLTNILNQLAGSVSRLLTGNALQGTSPGELAEIATTSVITNSLVGGGAVLRPSRNASGLHPHWRSTLIETIATPLDPTLLPNVSKAFFNLSGPDGGAAYLNEAGYYDPYWPSSFWGSHYNKLLSIKHKYDPNDQLVVLRGVGSDRWSEDLMCSK